MATAKQIKELNKKLESACFSLDIDNGYISCEKKGRSKVVIISRFHTYEDTAPIPEGEEMPLSGRIEEIISNEEVEQWLNETRAEVMQFTREMYHLNMKDLWAVC